MKPSINIRIMNEEIKILWCDDERIYVMTNNGEILSLPLEVSPVLLYATPEERMQFKIWDDNQSIRWESLDVDIHISHFHENVTANYDNEVNRMLSAFEWLDLKKFANKIGTNWEKLVYYKTGIRKPNPEMLARISRGLKSIRQETIRMGCGG